MSALLTILLAAIAGAAEPVTLVFPSGGRLSGVLLDESRGLYVLERDGGQLEFPHAAVAEVVRAPNAEGEFRAREAALPPKDAAALWDLAHFAAENGLLGRADRTARRVLALDADHAGARAYLGYERIFGEWLSGDALKRAKGWVRHEGSWMTLAQRRFLLDAEVRAREDAADGPTPPRYDGLAAAINSLVLQLDGPRQTGQTRFVLMDGGASARAHARRATHRFGRASPERSRTGRDDEVQGAQPWRPEPFRAGSPTLGIPPMDPVGSRFGY